MISVRRSKTLEPELNRFQQYQRDPDSSSRLTQQFDVTKKQQKLTPMGVKSHTSAADATDLNLMVRGTGTGGQVSSVCSQVEAPRTVDQVSAVIGFQFTCFKAVWIIKSKVFWPTFNILEGKHYVL